MLDLFHDCVWFIEFQHPKSPVFNMTFPALMSPTMWLLITHFTEYTMFQCWSTIRETISDSIINKVMGQWTLPLTAKSGDISPETKDWWNRNTCCLSLYTKYYQSWKSSSCYEIQWKGTIIIYLSCTYFYTKSWFDFAQYGRLV